MKKRLGMNKRTFGRILFVILVWRFFLFFVLFFSQRWLGLQNDFLGGGKSLYISNPYLWSWLNFDGEHYLAIAREGYRPLTYFFFPLYPIVVKYLSELLGGSLVDYAISGLFISNGLFIGVL